MNDNRILFGIEGIRMNLPADHFAWIAFLIFCIGTTILLFGIARLIKTIAPEGFFNGNRNKRPAVRKIKV